jgi:tetratricopeptide (TPR) repeat protein
MLADSEHAKSIAKKLGYLPLALEQAGAYISDVQLQLGEYLPLFEKYRRDLLKYETTCDICTARKETVFTTWELSFESLERHDACAAELMLLLAFLHHESPWEGLFRLGSSTNSTKTSRSDADDFRWLAKLCTDEFQFKNAFGKIVSVSLAKRGPLPGSLYLHPLVHAWGRDRLTPQKRHRKLIHALVVIGNALEAIAKLPSTTENWILKHRVLAHADACIDFAKSECEDMETFFMEPEAALALFQISALYRDFGRLRQAEMFLRSLLRATVVDTNNPIVYEGQILLAEVLLDVGMHGEAEELYRTSMKAQTTLLGTDHPKMLASQVGLGILLWEIGRLDEAEDLLKDVMVRLGNLPSKVGCIGQDAANNLGMVYWHQGRLKEAETCYKMVLDELAVDGQNGLAYLEPYYRLAIIYHETGRWDMAEAAFRKIYLDRQKYLGPDNLATLRTANALGHVLLFRGRYGESRKFLDIASVGQQKLMLSADHPALLRTVFNIGLLNCKQGMYDEALEWLERACLLWEKAYGERHHSFLSSLTELAGLMLEMGQPEEALPKLERIRLIQRESFRPDKPHCIRSEKVLGDTFLQLGRLEEANAVYESIVDIGEKALGRNHPGALVLHLSVARLRFAQGHLQEARETLRDIVGKLNTTVGNHHPITLDAIGLLGEVYWQEGNYEQGQTHLEQAIHGMTKHLGTNHPKTTDLISKWSQICNSNVKSIS